MIRCLADTDFYGFPQIFGRGNERVIFIEQSCFERKRDVPSEFQKGKFNGRIIGWYTVKFPRGLPH